MDLGAIILYGPCLPSSPSRGGASTRFEVLDHRFSEHLRPSGYETPFSILLPFAWHSAGVPCPIRFLLHDDGATEALRASVEDRVLAGGHSGVLFGELHNGSIRVGRGLQRAVVNVFAVAKFDLE